MIIWNIAFYLWIYKRDAIYSGWGDPETNPYTKVSKKAQIFAYLAEATFLITLYSYWLCVVGKYVDAYPKDEAKDEKD